MEPFTIHTGVVATLDRSDVDTDQIIAKQFLKRIERTGFGEFLFWDWRKLEDGSDHPDFELNYPHYAGASILLTRRNFGCGSSREHAVWAIADYGFRAVIAPSFADIFYNNCFKNGVLPIALTDEHVDQMFHQVRSNPRHEFTINLHETHVKDGHDNHWPFEIDESRRHNLLHGLDDIAVTLQHEHKISEFERRQAGRNL